MIDLFTFPCLQRFSHVFSAESKDKASEILTAICKGYKEGMKQPQGKEITGSKTGTQKKKEGQSKHKSSREASDKKVCLPSFGCIRINSTFVSVGKFLWHQGA